jgi:hypothetical protein
MFNVGVDLHTPGGAFYFRFSLYLRSEIGTSQIYFGRTFVAIIHRFSAA